jgi:DNA mismatch repair ATPase MutS
VAAYADWFLLANVNHYFKSIDLVFAQRAFLRESYRLCANLEADVALARHLLGTSSWCWAERSTGRELVLEQGVHPLLDDAAPLSIALDGKGGFISGQNGVGKSTFLRMVGLNLIAARAFGFGYARRARLPASPVYASMRNEDSLPEGESLYIAELRRARELLVSARSDVPGIYLIDEIFRGTNHIESVSAATAVLSALSQHALVFVASHNLVLAPLLTQCLDPYVIKKTSNGGLALERGVLAEPNGIALLAAYGFEPEVQAKAAEVARWLNAARAAPA